MKTFFSLLEICSPIRVGFKVAPVSSRFWQICPLTLFVVSPLLCKGISDSSLPGGASGLYRFWKELIWGLSLGDTEEFA